MISRHRPLVAAALAVAATVGAACGANGDPEADGAPSRADDTGPTTSSGAPAVEPTDSTTVPIHDSTEEAVEAEPANAPGTSTTDPLIPTSTTTSTVDPESLEVDASCVEELDVRSAAALLVWPAAEPSQWDEVTFAVTELHVGGVILMRPGDWDTDEIRTRLAELESASRHGLIVSTDEEGGDVQRLRALGLLDSQRDVSARRSGDLAEVRDLVARHGEAVRSVGVDVVFGPVVDVAPTDGDPPLARSRFFEGGPASVAELAAAYVEGWRDADVIPTLKHFPGHGSASGDTHDVPGVTPTLEELEAWDLEPYRALSPLASADALAVMVGHLTVPGLTDDLPASRSPAAIELLRSIPGYADALVVTDALGMAAVGLDEPDAAVASLVAGVDIALFTRTSQTAAVIDAIVGAVADGTLAEADVRESAARVMRLLERDGHTCDRPAR